MQKTSITKIAGWVALVLLIGLIFFQMALVLGAPWGQAAWGGEYEGVLPFSLRMGSLVSVLILVIGVLSILERADIYQILKRPLLTKIVIWILVLIFGLSTFGNLMSSSPIEKMIMTPVAILLFTSNLIVAIVSSTNARRAGQ